MANAVYSTEGVCKERFKRGSLVKHQHHSTSVPPTGLLEFMAVDTLSPLPQTKKSNQLFVIIMHRCSELTREISTTKTLASYVVTILYDDWIIPYGIPSFLLTDDGAQFVAELFEIMYLEVKVKPLTMVAYHLQKNGKVKRYSKILSAQLCHYM